MSEVVIRPARLADLPEILTLWRQLQDINAAVDPRLTLSGSAPDWMADFLREQMDNPNAAVLVALTGADPPVVVGYTLGQILRRPTLADGDCGYVADLCVRENRRGQGIGRRLYERLRAWFVGQGLTAIEVQVVRANPASQAFWRKMGCGEFLRTLRTEM